MDQKDILYFIASIIGISSFFLTDILFLRALYLVSSTLFVISGYIFHIKVMMIMNVFYMIVNIVQIVRLILERTTVSIPDELKPLYTQLFSIMLPKEFLSWMRMGRKKYARTNEYLLYEGEEEDYLRLIMTGSVSVIRNKIPIVKLKPYVFVGEMRFLTDKPASADILTLSEVSYYEWEFNKLNSLREKKPHLYMKIVAILSQDLIEKLHRSHTK